MKSPDTDDDLDLDRGLPVTPADVEALRRLRFTSMSFEACFAFLKAMGAPDMEALRSRRLSIGERFTLPPDE